MKETPQEKKISINSENILPIIKKWLYSEKEIFLRELVSNSSDSLSKLKLIDPSFKEHRIDIKIDKDKKTLTISDNGIGMSLEEVEKYIAQIAFSGAEDFIKNYESGESKDQIIGHFGLGFYSAFMVSEKVEIRTQSHNSKEKSVFWSCDGSSSYQIQNIKKIPRGCEVTLYLDKDNLDLLEEEKLNSLLLKYCPFFSFPIYLNDKHINNKDPLWIKNPTSCKDEEYIEFYKELYPFDPEPMFWIHLNIDFPFDVKGILYFPKISTKNLDLNKTYVKLFCSRVFVSENTSDILPKFLSVLKGAIDSKDIPLNVSRSYLQVDKNVRQLSNHISKKICSKLTSLFKNDKKKFEKIWPDIEPIIKLGMLDHDNFFEKSKDFLIFEDIENTWLSITDYVEKNKDQKTIFYTHKNSSNLLLETYKEKRIKVLYLNNYIDIALINLLEQKLEVKFSRIDSTIDESIIDSTKEKDLLDENGKTESSKIASFMKNSLEKDIEVEAKSLTNNSLNAFLMINEDERRFNDYMQITQNISQESKYKLVVNTNSPLIDKIYKLNSKKPDLAKCLAKEVYERAKISQKELKEEDLANFINKSSQNLSDILDLV